MILIEFRIIVFDMRWKLEKKGRFCSYSLLQD
jgi:hypothetical protein